MTKRKFFLLSACAFFFALYLVQTILSLQSSVKTKKLKTRDEIDTIEIAANGKMLSIVRENGEWLLGEERYRADEKKISSMLDSLSRIVLLDTVAHRLGESEKSQYEIRDDFKVNAVKSGKIVRTVFIGKNANTMQQTYIALDDEKKVYLAAGDFKTQFGKTVDDLRSMSVYALTASDIVSVSAKTKTAFLAFQNENGIWKSENSKSEIDGEKVSGWISSIANLSAEKWLPKDFAFPSKIEVDVEIKTKTGTVSLTVYKEKNTYAAKASGTPYPFTVSEYDAKKFLKNESDFQKATIGKE